MPPDRHCRELPGRQPQKVAAFGSNRFSKNKGDNGWPYFMVVAHMVTLSQDGADIVVNATGQVNSFGFKTSSTEPAGVAPKFSYELTFSNGETEKVIGLVTLDFEAGTRNDPFSEIASVTGRNVRDVAKVCWSISDYRLVKDGSNRGNSHIPPAGPPADRKAS